MGRNYPPCPNPECAKFGRQGTGNVVRRGRCGQGRRRYKRNACRATFSETRGSFTYRLRKSPAKVGLTHELRRKGFSLRKIARHVQVSVNTVRRWLTLPNT